MTKYLHTMIRVSSLEDTIAFFEVLGLREFRRRPDEKGRYTNVFLAAPGDEAAAVELTYNWDHLHRATAGRRSAAACRTLDQHGQYRFMVERDASGVAARSRARKHRR
jgi:catechol 2,3-dioxygenase-like lactoylglutathione lyase family enzyme